MSYLIDTNIISEIVRMKPAKKVAAWFKHVPVELMYLSTLTLGEIRSNIEQATNTKNKAVLKLWLDEELSEIFAHRILPVDSKVAECWGRIISKQKRPLPPIHSLIAATALHYDLTLVTQNEKYSAFEGLQTINPWKL